MYYYYIFLNQIINIFSLVWIEETMVRQLLEGLSHSFDNVLCKHSYQ